MPTLNQNPKGPSAFYQKAAQKPIETWQLKGVTNKPLPTAHNGPK